MNASAAPLHQARGSVAESARRIPHALARDFRTNLKGLSRLRPARFLSAAAADWIMIVAAAALAAISEHVAVSLASALIIAGRQHALLILMHDGAHFRLHPNHKWNDRISDWILAYPFFLSTEKYRANHVAHHAYLNTDDDPDWVRKLNDDWDLPKTKIDIALLLIRDLCGGGVIDQLKAVFVLGSGKTRGWRGGSARVDIGRILFYVIAAALLFAFDAWAVVALYWVIPMMTILPALLRIRSIAEHFGLSGEHEMNSSRNYRGPVWERCFFTPHNVGYHLDHHLFPSVPFYNLPALHALLEAHPIYRTAAHQNDSLFNFTPASVASDITTADDFASSKKDTALNRKRNAVRRANEQRSA